MKVMAGVLLSPWRGISKEEDTLHKVLLIGALFVAVADVALAQGMDIQNRFGPSGTHFQLPADTQAFNYEATITGGTVSYRIEFKVFVNGVLKLSAEEVVAPAPPVYHYSSLVNMSTWGLKPGDVVTFQASVVDLVQGNVLDVDYLYGDVIG
jgi:hypothetical protein